MVAVSDAQYRFGPHVLVSMTTTLTTVVVLYPPGTLNVKVPLSAVAV